MVGASARTTNRSVHDRHACRPRPGGPEGDGEGAGVRLEFRRTYPDPIEEVWAAVTESDRSARWIGTWTGRRGVGSTVEFTMTGEDGAGPEPVQILECEPPRRLVVDWSVPGQPRWRVEVTLSPEGIDENTGGTGENTGENTGTSLLFVHRLASAGDVTDVAAGWHYYLDRLAAALADRPGPECDDVVAGLTELYAR
ncbi:SRPBCC family protein [Actinopolymorpha sp. NPDC004070]|uniref:SRPBCC family protein n=1 Tax=Actinopolymorpha sp. NPDC004070 TaxID=3154548 RepID=UPI0033BC308D